MIELAEPPSFWSQVGSALGSAARVSGRTIASAYKAIDPDVRRHVAQMPLVDHDEVIEAFAPGVPITRSAMAFALGARTGVRMVVMPMPAARAAKWPASRSSLHP